ncbi:hypothetical protein Tco_0538967, partial [Tanacetum coccineum]
IVAGERIPDEASPAEIPQRHVAGDLSPATCRWGKGQNVAREDVECCSEVYS